MYNPESGQNPLLLDPRYTIRLTPEQFQEIPVIKKMTKDKAWTISTKKKLPVDMPSLLQNGEIRPAKVVNFENEFPLIPLDQFNLDPRFRNTNRAYRISALKNRILAIDVEPKASDEMLKKWTNFPASFMEVSRNGGLHILIQVPDDLITPENEYMFDSLTQIRSPENDVEYFFNNHFITFTLKQIAWFKPSSFNLQAQKDALKSLLQHLVDIDKEAKERRLKTTGVSYSTENLNLNLICDHIDPEKQTEIYKLMTYSGFVESLPTLESKENDLSRWEWSTAMVCTRRLLGILSAKIDNAARHKAAAESLVGTILSDSKNLEFAKWTDDDVIHVIHYFVKDVLPYREKHDRIEQDGLPWLLHTTKKAFAYIKTADQKEGKTQYDSFYSRSDLLQSDNL